MLKPGTRAETRGLPAFGDCPAIAPEQLVIVKPRAASLPLPGIDWYIVKFISRGDFACMHSDSFVVIDDAKAKAEGR